MIKVIEYTKNPLNIMGKVASECWNSTPSPQIGIECIKSGHGRISEYAEVTVEIGEYSARVMREIYTHIVGTSRVQGSTRYIDYKNIIYYTPPTIERNELTKEIYDNFMKGVQSAYTALLELSIPKQDIANILPLGMHSKMVLKINARALINMAELRLCTRALKEFRDFMNELLKTIAELDEQWSMIISFCKPKCLTHGYCNEKFSCGIRPRKEVVEKLVLEYITKGSELIE